MELPVFVAPGRLWVQLCSPAFCEDVCRISRLCLSVWSVCVSVAVAVTRLWLCLSVWSVCVCVFLSVAVAVFVCVCFCLCLSMLHQAG